MTVYARIRYFFATLGAYLAGGTELIELRRMKSIIAKHDANFNKHNADYRRWRK